MKKFAELKQYLEKQLQTKKFLQEGLDFVDQLNQAQEEYASTQRKIVDEKKALEGVLAEKLRIQSHVDEARAKADDAIKGANGVVAKATKQAEDIVQQAKDKAFAIIDKAEAEADVVDAYVLEKKDEIKKLDATLVTLHATKITLDKAMEALRKKLG